MAKCIEKKIIIITTLNYNIVKTRYVCIAHDVNSLSNDEMMEKIVINYIKYNYVKNFCMSGSCII